MWSDDSRYYWPFLCGHGTDLNWYRCPHCEDEHKQRVVDDEESEWWAQTGEDDWPSRWSNCEDEHNSRKGD
jgi:hypothetical protein